MKPAVTKMQGPILTTEQLLKQVDLQVYAQPFKAFGIDKSEDLFALKPQDWQKLKVKPLHKTKLIDAATQHRLQISRGCQLHQYIFSSSGPYNATHKPESMLNFDPQGYGVSNTNNCFMVFGFNKPVNLYGAIIGNNAGVSGGWGSGYLEGVQIQVQVQGSENWVTAHTIKGMPNGVNTAYLAKINQSNVTRVRFWKNSYFSTSYVHFV